MAFFVLLAVLVLGFSLVLSNISHAAFTMDAGQKNTFKNTFQQQITASGGPKYTDQELDKIVADYEKKFNSFDDAMKALNDNTAGERLANMADVGGQVNVQGESLFVKIALEIIIAVLSVIAYFLKYLVSWGGATLDLTLRPELYNFVNNDMIRQGWVVVRDICNLFFLLALLFIAICTILKIDKYHAKKTLLTLIIMALLINFSKPIAIFVFDGSQLLMNFFLVQLNNNQQSATSMYMAASKIADTVYGDVQSLRSGNTTTPAIAVMYLFSVIFLFILAVAFFVIAIFLIIRIVAVMLLIIVSPLAFFAAIIPDFNKISGSWWDALFKYCYFGPAAAFFLLLATKLQGSLPQLGNVNMGANADLTKIASNVIHYLTVVIFLYASVIMAQKFGIYAAAGITGNANRFMKWAGKGAAMAPYRATAWGAKTSGVSGGVQQKIAASRFGKYLTKKGREDAQKDREAGVAERLGVKGAKEGREKQKVADLEERWKKEGRGKEDFKKSIHSKDAVERKAAARQLMKQGEASHVINSEIARQGLTGNAVTQFYDKELGNLSSNDLGKHDLEALSASPEGRQWVESRLKDYDTDPRLISNMLSGGHTKNFSFIRDLRTGGTLSQANNTQGTRQQNERVEVVRERAPRSRTTYDADGNPVT